MVDSLLELIRQRYLETLRSVNSRWKILIVDERSQVMLQSVLSTYDILEEGVQQVDLISAPRTSQPRLAAIYILMPNIHNVDLVLHDYNQTSSSSSQLKPSRKAKEAVSPPVEGSKYAAAHLHFVDGISDSLVSRLTATLPGSYLQALTELYINFHALEPRVFSLKSPNSFFTLYAPPKHNVQESVLRWEEEVTIMSRSIVNVLATLGEYPLIRYYDPPASFHSPLGPASKTGNHVGKHLAQTVQKEIDAYARDNPNFPPVAVPPRPRGVLIITDRSMDLYAPLIHEFTYQAMCNDLLDIEDGSKYRYSFRNAAGELEEKEAILSDADSVWTQVRHMHMKDALDKLIADFKTYAGEHGGNFGNAGGSSLNDMKDMLASLPQLREAKEKLSLHLTMAEKCMSLFESKKLPLSASVEQCCATGLTPEGKTPKTLVEEMVPLLDDRSVSSTDKLRIIAMYIMHRDGVPEGDKSRLYQHARLALREMDAVDNLVCVGVNISKDSGKKRKALFKQKEEEDTYDISRYQPSIKYMLEEQFAGKLDQTIFPYTRDAPSSAGSEAARASSLQTAGSLRSSRPQWTASRGRKSVNEPKQQVLVFVAGGLTYSEIRVAYKVSQSANKDVFVGSTNIITPAEFVRDLSNLGRGGGGGDNAVSQDRPSKPNFNPQRQQNNNPSRPPAVLAETTYPRYNGPAIAYPVETRQQQYAPARQEQPAEQYNALAYNTTAPQRQPNSKEVTYQGALNSSSDPVLVRDALRPLKEKEKEKEKKKKLFRF